MKEHDIQGACEALAEALRLQGFPIYCTRTNAGTVQTKTGYWVKLCRAGHGDLTLMIYGLAVQVECKIRTGKQRKTQKAMQKICEETGQEYWLCYTVGAFRDKLAEWGIVYGGDISASKKIMAEIKKLKKSLIIKL